MDEKLEWLSNGRVLYAARSGQESLTALAAFTEKVRQCLDREGQLPIHVIWHMSGLTVEGVDRRRVMTLLNRIMKHPNLRWFVVVDPDMPPLRRFLAAALLRLSGVRWRTVDSVSEGQAFLKKVDASLPE